MNYFFGDKRTALIKKYFDGRSQRDMLTHEYFDALADEWKLSAIVLADQVHGIDGIIIQHIEDACSYAPYNTQADFMVTNIVGVALAVETADCASIIAYDPCEQVVGIAHAGWQGTLNGVAVEMVKAMQRHFGCKYEHLEMLLGPCASIYAYEVGDDFCDRVNFFKEHCLRKQSGKWHFDMPRYSELLLQQHGVRRFKRDHNACTIQDHNFCSHRREPAANLRQLSLVAL